MTTQYDYGPWTLHDGGTCPVASDTMVETLYAMTPFGDRMKSANGVRPAGQYHSWRWVHGGELTDIAFYRIATEKKPLVRYIVELDAGSGPFLSSVTYETPEEAKDFAKRNGYKLCRIVRFVETPE